LGNLRESDEEEMLETWCILLEAITGNWDTLKARDGGDE